MNTPMQMYPPMSQLQPLAPARGPQPWQRAEARAARPAGPPRYKLALGLTRLTRSWLRPA